MLAVCFALIDSAEEKDRFTEIYGALERKLFALSMNRLRDTGLAEDAVSETFFRLAVNWRRLRSFDDSELTAFAVVINRNLCSDMLSSEIRYQKSKEQAVSDLPDDELRKDTEEAVTALPQIYRDTVMLSYYYGFSNEEIAKLLGLSLIGVKKRLSRAREMLRKELSEDD